MTTATDDPLLDTDSALDTASIEADITAGARAFKQLLTHATDDWTSWSITIIGFRALRNVAFAKGYTSDIRSYAYRQAMSHLLQLRRYSVYDQIDKPTRSACYKLMDRIDDINMWYAALAPADQLRWKHPQSIMKHAPRHLVEGGRGGNRPKAGKKKPVTSVEIERLRALLLRVIKRLIKHEPEAAELLDQVNPDDRDPNDGLEDI
jgi:hypothetical protein